MGAGTIWLIVGFVAIAYAVYVYNKLVSLRNRFRNAFSQIDVQLQRRYELIPNLVEVARGYMQHEHETLTEVTEARNNASSKAEKAAAAPDNASLVNALAGAEKQLVGAMGRLNVVMEAYPDLKADVNMQDLHTELTSTDNRVSYARQAYSDSVMRYNTYREQIPANFIAMPFKFTAADLFEIDEADAQIREPVRVSFDKAA